MYDIFREMVLTEAVPRKAAELKIAPDDPPDITRPPGDQIPEKENNNQQQNQQPSDTIPQEDMPQMDQQQALAAQQQQQMMQQGQQVVVDQNGQPVEEVPPEEQQDPNAMQQDPNAPMGPEGMDPAQEPMDDLQAAEQDIFKDFTPDQLALRDKELKKRFQEINSIIIETIEKLNKVTKTAYDSNMLDFIIRKLIDLKEISRDSLVDGFKTRTYTQNRMELEKIATEFNLITNMVEEIYNSRIKRAIKTSKGNNMVKTDSLFYGPELSQDFSI